MEAVDLLMRHAFLQRALLAALLVAAATSLLSVFVVLRGMSLLGDGLAHASFAGIAVALVTGWVPTLGALVAAVAAGLVIQLLRTRGVVAGDTAIGILFTFGLAAGFLVLDHFPRARVLTLEDVLFGSVLGVTSSDLTILAGLVAAVLLVLTLLHKEFVSLTLDADGARLAGLPVVALETVFTVLTATAIVAAARIVGVLLVTALIVVPAATSLQLARSFRGALTAAVVVGLAVTFAGFLGSLAFDLAVGATITALGGVVFAVTALARRAFT